MADRGRGGERSRDLERLLTFVDAVVAIAITLLVLPLVDLVAELRVDDSVVDLLGRHQVELGAFLLSFAVISSLWFSQHRMMSAVVDDDRVLSRLLMLWTLTIVFLPFPTALVAQEGHQAATKVLYVGTMVLSSTCLALIATWVGRHPALHSTGALPDPGRAWATTAALLAALVLALAVPAVGYWALLLVLLAGPALRLWRRGRHPRVRPREAPTRRS
jgi:uncharacterized membrane protein